MKQTIEKISLILYILPLIGIRYIVESLREISKPKIAENEPYDREKELIDYAIRRKREEREKEILEWGCALPIGLIIALFFAAILKSC